MNTPLLKNPERILVRVCGAESWQRDVIAETIAGALLNCNVSVGLDERVETRLTADNAQQLHGTLALTHEVLILLSPPDAETDLIATDRSTT